WSGRGRDPRWATGPTGEAKKTISGDESLFVVRGKRTVVAAITCRGRVAPRAGHDAALLIMSDSLAQLCSNAGNRLLLGRGGLRDAEGWNLGRRGRPHPQRLRGRDAVPRGPRP